MRPRTVHCLAWRSLNAAVLSVFLSCSPSSGQQAQPTRVAPTEPGENARLLESIGGELSSSISVSGAVVDDVGNPVTDVNLQVRIHRFNPLATDLFGESVANRRVSGRFSAGCQACQSMVLVFWKEGFLGCTLEYFVGGTATMPVRPVSLRGEVAVLRRLHTLARLARFEGRLAIASPDEFDVITPDMRPNVWTGERRVIRIANEMRFAKEAPRPASPRTPDAVVTVPFVALGNSDSVGGIVGRSEQKTLDGNARHGRYSPAGVHLWTTDAQGGFVVFTPRQPRTGEPSPHIVAGEMDTCPESGYARSIPLSGNGAYTYFYCRIGPWFGKGYVAGLKFWNSMDPKEVSANIRIALNPDGSRNVAGLPW